MRPAQPAMNDNRLERLEISLTKGIADVLTDLRNPTTGNAMTPDQLAPRPPRRKKQPTADQMRSQLAAAADTIASLRTENERLRKNLCVRVAGFFHRLRSFKRTT